MMVCVLILTLNMNEEYSGIEIRFDKEREMWYFLHDHERVEDASLKKIKTLIDKMKRNKFERIKVFVQTDRYRYGGGKDPKYLPQYELATITSISPQGQAYFVREGKKNAEKQHIKWHSFVVDSQENRKIIADIEKCGEIEWRAERDQEASKKKLKELKGAAIYKDLYGKEL